MTSMCITLLCSTPRYSLLAKSLKPSGRLAKLTPGSLRAFHQELRVSHTYAHIIWRLLTRAAMLSRAEIYLIYMYDLN